MTDIAMDSAAWPLLVKLLPAIDATASAIRPTTETAMTLGRRAMTDSTSTASALSPSSRPITAWALRITGPFEIALPTLWPWSAAGTVTYRLTYIPSTYSASSSTTTARLARRNRARLARAGTLTLRVRLGEPASRLIG